MEQDNMGMSIKEASRLIDWLKSKGLTDADATECIKYIAGTEQPQQDPGK